MKFFLRFFLAFLLTSPALARPVAADSGFVPVYKAGIKAGLNLVNYSNFDFSDAYLSAHGGILGGVQLSPGFGLGGEILYSRLGISQGYGDLTLNYVSFPVMINLHGGPVIFQGGLFGSYLLSAKSEEEPGKTELTDNFESTDYGFLLGLVFSPSGNFFFGLRLNVGLPNIVKKQPVPPPGTVLSTFSSEMITRNTQVSIGYKF